VGNAVIVIGTYPNRRLAEVDYEDIARNRDLLRAEKVYAVALVERTDGGKIKVVNSLEPDTEHAAISGTVVGALVGFLFPAAILVTAAAGLGIGRVAGHLWRGISRKDLLELGTALDSGEGAVLVFGAQLPEAIEAVLPSASQIAHRETSHKHEDIEALIAELRTEHEAGQSSVAGSETGSGPTD
jgi:uncharacterized membrane protein